MVFSISSSIFIFLFLPLLLLVYYSLKKFRFAQNILLLAASLFFYSWGRPKYLLVLLASIIFNYLFGLWIHREKEKGNEAKGRLQLAVTLGVLFNVGLLFTFKYVDFAIENINLFLPGDGLDFLHLPFPVGISFYTFMAISYIVDVKRGRVDVQKNILDLGLYISFFPCQLMVPIVKYKSISEQLIERNESFEMISQGLCRFVIGLAKKLIIADSLLEIVKSSFDSGSQISVAMAWLGMFAYSLQIYYDFSGYVDMAIGVGKMFGFRLPENFDYPYISTSVKEYWVRWHMTLGQWFKDYILLPLTFGNALKFVPFTKKKVRMPNDKKVAIAMLAVWFSTGLWHGASYLFILWGLYYFVLMRLEMRFKPFKNKVVNFLVYFTYATFAVKFGQVVFRSHNLTEAGHYFMTMFGLNGAPLIDNTFLLNFFGNKYFLLIASIGCFPVGQYLAKKIKMNEKVVSVAYMISIITLMIISVSYLFKGTWAPFIYFNF